MDPARPDSGGRGTSRGRGPDCFHASGGGGGGKHVALGLQSLSPQAEGFDRDGVGIAHADGLAVLDGQRFELQQLAVDRVGGRFGIDDAVGAVAVHGYAGFIGLVICGFMLWGAPSSPYEGYATINPLGMFVGALIMFGLLGFLPGWAMVSILNGFGVLRVPRKVELEGLDFGTEESYRAAVDEVRNAELALLRT